MGKSTEELLRQLTLLRQQQAEPAPGADADAAQMTAYSKRQVGIQYRITQLDAVVAGAVRKLPEKGKLGLYFALASADQQRREASSSPPRTPRSISGR